MEVGAVKQAFNNEIILLKKKLNQARIQIIHKLTRKAKTLAEKKAPEKLKEKMKRKAQSAVNEVLILKKIKPKELGKFIVTHKGKLADYLNKPQIDHDKACARLLLHKALEDKYEFIRNRFSNVPIKDLFMSRIERQKIKKEEKEKQKAKKKAKEEKKKKKDGDWNVEDVKMGDAKQVAKQISDDDMSGDDSGLDVNGDQSANEHSTVVDDDERSDISEADEKVNNKDDISETKSDGDESEGDEVSGDEEEPSKSNLVRLKSPEPSSIVDNREPKQRHKTMPKQIDKPAKLKKEKKNKDNTNKNRNLNDKLKQRKFKKDSAAAVQEAKVVDPFFITSTGQNYMSLAEPREPDEVKEIHKQGNRKLRRAVMFGHVPKIKARKNNYDSNNYNNNDRFNKPTGYNSKDNNNRFDNKNVGYQNRGNKFDDRNKRPDFKGRNADKSNSKEESKPEKLHPSWEAKKKQSGILPFEGKKIVFD